MHVGGEDELVEVWLGELPSVSPACSGAPVDGEARILGGVSAIAACGSRPPVKASISTEAALASAKDETQASSGRRPPTGSVLSLWKRSTQAITVAMREREHTHASRRNEGCA
jgi:hypothetical protein